VQGLFGDALVWTGQPQVVKALTDNAQLCRHARAAGASIRPCTRATGTVSRSASAPKRGQDYANGSVVRQSGRRSGGFLGDFMPTPLPPSAGRCDVSDNGLSSRMNAHMLNRHFLLPACAALAVQCHSNSTNVRDAFAAALRKPWAASNGWSGTT
jgi:hypothetical protein